MKKTFRITLFSLIALGIISCSNEDDLNIKTENIQNEKRDNNPQNAKFDPSKISRYWKQSGNEFLYTNNPSEVPQGYAWQMFLGSANNGEIGIGRWYNPSTGDRLLTITNEVDYNPSWVFEGKIGYATNSSSGIPVYRYRKYNGGRHLFTVDYNEVGGGNSYWIYEGIAFYSLPF